MARRLDIGIASYKSPEKLKKCVEAVKDYSLTDWFLLIVHNPSPEDEKSGLSDLLELLASNPRIKVYRLPENVGYAGAVNKVLTHFQSEYVAYLDNDTYVQTPGWDEKLCEYLDRFHEIGMIFPNGGAYPIQRGAYTEVMWSPGYCWVLNRLAMKKLICRGDYDSGFKYFDEELGHQEEADVALRLRMAGYKCATAVEVKVHHDATHTRDPQSIERIGKGVTNFVNKWTRYFGGVNLNYHSPNVLRWEDWIPNALYLEEYWKTKLPGLNDVPEVVEIDGRKYDLIKVPRLHGFYTGRII